MNTDSILMTIRELVISDPEETCFDNELLVHINATLSRLYELRVIESPIKITNVSETWENLLFGDIRFEDLKSYIYYKVKLAFDPPSNSYTLSYFKEESDKLEWLLTYRAEEVHDLG